ncbi:hypothetical protein OMR72_003015 [Vibrio parahaemolyticus]|uniref:hypothetical protein n=1 Tax=Vibrio harveyi group TaxID=717610 RepID=UPI0003FF1FC6|nr:MULTISPECIES: hypothetical protein [Vibrio harveyi group]EGQ9183339.1 hypothetical protein [Vibrio parahaemolyticus]EGR1738015.1 hypothetical protein [Vibrio parahaemolyticus]EGR2229768.1 hypothetical protein [Vibrio parahaemolyticus]EHH3658774.1 hypothetical protein [Vibrio parahaemolyticus]EHK0032270.1 hypothetical protein [Vibrio parahaemolyticus]
MERNKPLELLCMLAGLIAIAFIFYGRANFDVPASSYAQVQRWIEENPSATPMLNEFMSDGKLTQNEFDDLRVYIKDAPKRALLSKIAEAQ